MRKITESNFELNSTLRPALIMILIISLVFVSVTPVFAGTEEPDPGEILPMRYTVSLDRKGGTLSTSQITVTQGSIYGELPVPKKEYYNFLGWFTDPVGGEEVTSGAIADDNIPTMLYARWKGIDITVSLDPNRGLLENREYVVNYGEDYTVLPTPARNGLVFMGWYTKKTGGAFIDPDSEVLITEETQLYAKWAPVWYLQTDKRWSKKWYRVRKEKSTIGSAGCGPSAMAMVVASLKNNSVTPVTACKWSKKKKYKAYCSGTKDGFFKAYAKKYGIKIKQTYYGDLRYKKKSKAKKYHTQAKNAVKNGNWVIVLAGKGKWTKGSGHFILWYKTEGDYAYIRDSNSTSSARAKAKVSTLQKQAKRYWIITVPESKKVN